MSHMNTSEESVPFGIPADKVQAMIDASGHVEADSLLILATLKANGWNLVRSRSEQSFRRMRCPIAQLVDDLRHGRGLCENQNELGHVVRDAWVHETMQRAADRLEELQAELAALKSGMASDASVGS